MRAAHQEFLEHGFHGATVAAVARRADVAVQTVYFVFRTKAELISAVIDTAVMGEDEPVTPEQSAWWAAMTAEPDPAAALRLFVRGAAPLFERASSISEVLRGAALTDPEVREIHARHEQRRREAFRQVIEMLAARGQLGAGLDPDTATDVFLVVCGDAVWHQLRNELGWTGEQVADWMCDALPRLLLVAR